MRFLAGSSRVGSSPTAPSPRIRERLGTKVAATPAVKQGEKIEENPMTGKITGFENRPVQVGGKGPAVGSAGKSADAPGMAVSNAAQVRLTASAVQLAALEKALAQVPDVDLQRVQSLRNEIQSGEYRIDSQRIAAKLLQLERALAAAEPRIPDPLEGADTLA
jgi:negative regulator of flagellin synthesis FlgM